MVIQKNIHVTEKNHKRQFEKISEDSETDRADILELSDQGFKTTTTSEGKRDSIQEQMGNVSRKTEVVREKKNTMPTWVHQKILPNA